MDNWKINDAIRAVWTYIRSLNKYIDVTMPWALGKDPAKKDLLDNLCSTTSAKACASYPSWRNR